MKIITISDQLVTKIIEEGGYISHCSEHVKEACKEAQTTFLNLSLFYMFVLMVRHGMGLPLILFPIIL